MAQSVGYLFAAIGPVLFGALHDLLGDWQVALYFLFVVVAIQICAAMRAGSPEKIGGE